MKSRGVEHVHVTSDFFSMEKKMKVKTHFQEICFLNFFFSINLLKHILLIFVWLFKPAKIWSKHQIDVLHICSMSTFQILYDFLHVQCISNAYINLRWFYNSLQQCVISFTYMHVREYLLLSLWLHWEYIATFPHSMFNVLCGYWI